MRKLYNLPGTPDGVFIKKIRALFFFLLVGSTAVAQQGLATYSPVRATGIAYTSIAPGTSFPSWRSGTSTDDNMSTAAPIGFNFVYDGVQVCEVNASTNGFINLLTSTPNTNNGAGTGAYGYQNTAFTNNTLRVIAPFYEDLTTQLNAGTATDLNTSIIYNTTGAPGSRVFTVEWVNMKTFSAAGTLNFQVKLFEGSNNIRFLYGAMTATGLTYSAGLNSVTLSGTPAAGTLFTQLTANTTSFGIAATNALSVVPDANSQISLNYGGAAVAPLSGTFAIPGAYASIGAAINALNYNGTSGACTFNVAANSVFIEDPAPLQTACGASAIVFQKSGTGNNPVIRPTSGGANTSAAGIRIMGGDNITFNGIDINVNSGNTLNYGYLLTQNSNTNGAQNNTIQNCVVTLNKSNTNSIGFITSSVLTGASVVGGANSNNTFSNVGVRNSFRGVLFNGGTTAVYSGITINCSPDNNNKLTTSGCGSYNLIGDPNTPNDLGGTSTTTNPYGVGSFSQANMTIAYTKVTNLSITGAVFADGIYISNALSSTVSAGTTNVFNNQIFTLRSLSTNSGDITGLSLNNNNNASSVIRAYNNFIGDMSSANNTAGFIGVVGMGIQNEGTTSDLSSMQIWHNSISIAPSGINCSNTCVQTLLTTTGPVITVKNNIFANLTGAQSGAAKHYCMQSPSATVWGNTGSSSNFNDLYVANPANGFVGKGNTTDYATLAAWSAAMGGIDAPGSSISTDPSFGGPVDLHISAVALNNTGTATGNFVANDIDCQTRPLPAATNFDMGADETQQCGGVVSGGTILTAPASATICALQTYTMDAVGATTGIGITLQWEVSPTGGGAGFVSITGGSAGNSTPYTTGPLAAGVYYYRLRVTCSSGPLTVYSNELTLTVNPVPTIVVSPASGTLCQPGASPIPLSASGGVSYSWSPSTGLSAITGATVSANPLITTTYTVTGLGSNGCPNTATSTISVGPSFSLIATATPPAVCSGQNSQLSAAVNSNANEILITEVTLFKTGTGFTPSYPSYIGASDQDFVEISNITNLPVDISGWTIADYGNNLSTAVHSFVFPPGTIIPSNGVSVIHLGGGNTSAANRYFSTGGATDSWFSGDLVGIVLKNGSVVVDAVGVGTGYTFNAGTGVTAANWTGFAPAPGTFAGTIRTGSSDTNSGNDWSQSDSPTPLQSIGTYNGGYVTSLTIASYSWTPTTFLSNPAIANPIATAVTTTTTYTVTGVSAAGCPSITTPASTVTVTVAPLSCSGIITTGNRCAGLPTSITVNTLGGCAPYTYTWVIDGGAPTVLGATITPTLTAGPHSVSVTVSSANGNCNSSTTVNVNALPIISVTPPTSSICNPGGTAVTLTASGASTYSWNPSTGLSAITGTSVTAQPPANTTYTVTGTDANGCVGTGTATVNIGPAITATAISSAVGTICPGTNSTTLTANVVFPSNVYCNSTHSLGCGLGDEMVDVVIPTTTLNNTATGCSGSAYKYFTGGGSQTGTLTAGTAYSISVKFGSDAFGGQYFGAWIDYNRDGIFAPGEFLGASTNAGPNGTVAVPFTVPVTALNGVTRLRVVGGNDVAVAADQACDISSSSFGETEDYDVTITGGNNPVSSYLWTPNTNLGATATQNPATATNLTTTTTFTVVATTPSGCAATANVTVNVYPVVTAIISGTATICTGATTPVSVAFTGDGPWTFTYTDGVTPVTITSTSTNPYIINASPSGNTTYTVTAVNGVNCPGTFSGSAVITVNAVPTVSVSPATPSYCAGGSVLLTASGATTYTWSPAGGLSATTGTSVTASPSGTTTYTVTGNNPFPGCTANASVTVTVNPNLTASITIVSSSGTDICAGETVTFTATAVNGGLTPGYQWQVNGGNVGTNSPTYTTSTLTNGQVVTCILTTSALCATPNPVTSPGITMNVVTSPTAGVTLSASPVLCAGTPITITATAINGGGAPTYQFFYNGASTGPAGPGNTYIITAPATGNTVYVIMTSSIPCVTGSPVTSATYTVTLNVPPTNLAPTASCPSITPGSNTTLTNAAGPGSGTITNYQWVLNGVTNVGTNLPTYTTNVTGSYTVIITNSNGCSATSMPVSITPFTGALTAGTYNIPGAGGCLDFLTINAAVNHLNLYGILNNGPVIFNIASGYTETAPVGGFAITRTGTLASPITFKKAGGANPVITAAQQTAGSNTDALFKIVGADYITLRDFTLQENPLNTNNAAGPGNTMTEWGIALLHPNATPANGAQNNTIESNTISLNKIYRNTVGIYSNATHSETAAGTAQPGTGAAGANSANKFYGNLVSNVNIPAVFLGVAGNMDAGNDIGGTSIATANLFTNWGSATAINATTIVFNAVPSVVYGIYAANQTGVKINWNSVISAVGINVGTSAFRGIYADFTGTPTGTFVNSISNNTVTLNSSATVAGSLEAITHLNSSGSATAVTGMTLNINNNNIISNAQTGSATSAAITGISNAFPAGILTLSANILQGNSSTATSGSFTGIVNSAAVGTSIAIDNNQLGNASGDLVNFSAANAVIVNGISNTGGAANASLSVQSNDIRRIVYTSTGTGAHNYIRNTAATLSRNISSNTFTNLSINTSGIITFFDDNIALAAGGAETISNNIVVTGFTNTNLTGGALVFNRSSATSAATASITHTNNNFSNFTLTGTAITGWQSVDAGANTKNVSGNTFGNINNATSGGSISLMTVSGSTGATGASINNNSFGPVTGPNPITALTLSNVAATKATITGNDITGLNSSGGLVTGINSNLINLTLSTNTISNCTASGNMTAISVTGSTTLATINSNPISNLTSTGGNVVGITVVGAGTSNANVSSNTITGLSSTSPTANPSVVGLQLSGAVLNVTSNNINDLSGTGGTTTPTTTGIAVTAGSTVTLSKNQIFNLSQNSTATAPAATLVFGISSTGGTTTTFTAVNNFISDLRAPQSISTDAIRGINLAGVITPGAYNIYYNTIYLNAVSSGANFGTTGLYHASSGSATTSTLTLRNNIIDNESEANGSGFTVAYRRLNQTLTNYSTTSNNNLFYAGAQASPNFLFLGNTLQATTITALQGLSGMSPRETVSISVKPVFANGTTAPYDLHMDNSSNCSIAQSGNNSGILIPDDIDAVNVRSVVTPFITSIGADEFASLGTAGLWKGINTNWMDPVNWCGDVPNATTDVTIPVIVGSIYPIITTAAPIARNITISANTSITINPGGALSTKGSWTNNGTLTNNGLIVLNGTATQTFPGSGTGSIPAFFSLTVNNTAGAVINKPLTVNGVLKPKAGVITVNEVVTLHSDASGTASVDTVQGSFAYGGPGKFVVERYISSLTRTGWRFLSIATNTTQTIKQAWQEGETAPTYTASGYGMQIVGPSTAGPGFDVNTATPSLKTFSAATGAWVSVPGTLGNINLPANDGYMTFIRGDRGSNQFGDVSATTLRTQGPIKTGPITVSTANANVNQFMSVGNPFPSAIDFQSTSTVKTGLLSGFYLWDPKLGTFGGYQSFFSFNGYVAVPGGGSYSGGNKFIESGQAFFVYTSSTVGTHSLTLSENSKVGSNVQVARSSSSVTQLTTRLYVVSGSDANLYDGTVVVFDESNSNAVDVNDAPKPGNFGENFAIKRDGKLLSIESRAEIVETDTIFFALGQLRTREYQFEFTPEQLFVPGRTAYFEDAYLHTSTVLDLAAVSAINFSVNADAGSYASDRFRIVFKQLTVVPVSFTSITAFAQNKDVIVKWKVENELNIEHYDVERSADGQHFVRIGAKAALGNNGGTSLEYNWLDEEPLAGDNFYRIKSVGNNGDVKYSEIVKVTLQASPAMIAVYPNPVKEDGKIKISMVNQKSGLYQVKLISAGGQVVLLRKINHAGGTSVYEIGLTENSITHGTYLLQIGEGNKVKTSLKIVY